MEGRLYKGPSSKYIYGTVKVQELQNINSLLFLSVLTSNLFPVFLKISQGSFNFSKIPASFSEFWHPNLFCPFQSCLFASAFIVATKNLSRASCHSKCSWLASLFESWKSFQLWLWLFPVLLWIVISLRFCSKPFYTNRWFFCIDYLS